MTALPTQAASLLTRPADDHDPRFTLGLVSDVAGVPRAHPADTDRADLLPALHCRSYQPPNEQEPKL